MSIVHYLSNPAGGRHGDGVERLPGKRHPKAAIAGSDAAFRRPTIEESEAPWARARQLQAQALRDGGSFLARGLATRVRWLASWLREFGEALAAKRSYDVLSRLSDHDLAAMGLKRDDIPAVAWGRFRRAEAPSISTEAACDTGARQEYLKAA